MSTPVQSLNAALWRSLSEQATPKENPKGDLPSIAPGTAAWGAFKRDSNARAPYISQLNESLKSIQHFISEQALPGQERQVALGNLQQYLHTRVNCRPSDLSPLTLNENRRNLHLFAQQLNNPAIPIDRKLGIALFLAQGLGVCKEGETLNILEGTQQLCQHQGGLAGLLVSTKNTLVEQHLQQLVKREDKVNLPSKMAAELEIHHIQALKNHVASQWGFTVVEDRYATDNYRAQAGAQAEALLAQTITPALLANTVADMLKQALVSQAASTLTTGMPTEQLKTEPLRRAIQAEFGQNIQLEQCLEFNDDYSEVRLKPDHELALHVMHAFQEIGLISRHANPKHLLNQTQIDFDQAIEKADKLRGPLEQPRGDYSGFSPSFWLGLVMPSNHKNHDDRKEKLGRGILNH